MDIDELKDETKKIKAPDIGALEFGSRVRSVNGLVDDLKRRDAAEKKKLRRMMVIFGGVGGVLFAHLMLRDESPAARLGRGLLVLIYLLIVALAAIKSFGLGKIDYTEPPLVFLRKAEKRYRFIAPWEYLYIIPGLVVAGFAGWLMLSGFNYLAHPARAVLYDALFVLGFLALCAFGFTASRKIWERDKGPIHDKLKRAVKDFGGND